MFWISFLLVQYGGEKETLSSLILALFQRPSLHARIQVYTPMAQGYAIFLYWSLSYHAAVLQTAFKTLRLKTSIWREGCCLGNSKKSCYKLFLHTSLFLRLFCIVGKVFLSLWVLFFWRLLAVILLWYLLSSFWIFLCFQAMFRVWPSR